VKSLAAVLPLSKRARIRTTAAVNPRF